MTEITRSDELSWAAVSLKPDQVQGESVGWRASPRQNVPCSLNLIPPAKKHLRSWNRGGQCCAGVGHRSRMPVARGAHIPNTSSKLDRIEPKSEDWTTRSSHLGGKNVSRRGRHGVRRQRADLDERDNRDDELDGVPQRGVQKSTERLSDPERDLLRAEPKEFRKRDWRGGSAIGCDRRGWSESALMARKVVTKTIVSLTFAKCSAHPT